MTHDKAGIGYGWPDEAATDRSPFPQESPLVIGKGLSLLHFALRAGRSP